MSPKDAFWFKHDANARRDPKILALLADYHAEGYGRYWIIIELLREQSDYRLSKGKYLSRTLSAEWRCTIKEAEEFLAKLIDEYELLAADSGFVWSDSLCRRLEKWDELRELNRQKAEKRWRQEHEGESDSKEIRG